MWTEVYSPYLRQWIVIDPVRNKLRCKDVIEPSRSSLENQLLYVVAFEEDGSARDVTARYAKAFNNHTAKMRVPNRKGTNWWEDTITRHKRSFELNRDREETAELEGRKANEPLPTSLGAFKNHPNYVLEQHLHRDQVIRPGTKQIGLFNGQHQVFPRSGLVELKSAENYYRVGRVVRPGEMPLKWVKQQVSTINRRRAEEFNRLEGLEAEKQALYEHAQTELYVPPPVVDGKVPRNDFGNIDLFVPTMLPAGAVHLPSKSSLKYVCRDRSRLRTHMLTVVPARTCRQASRQVRQSARDRLRRGHRRLRVPQPARDADHRRHRRRDRARRRRPPGDFRG